MIGGLECVSIKRKVGESELKKDFEEFSRCMRIKWYFRHEPSQIIVKYLYLSHLSCHVCLTNGGLLEIIREPTHYSNLSKSECKVVSEKRTEVL